MSVSYTYDTLVAALQSNLDDEDADFAADLPELISRGELRLLRDLDLAIFDVTDEAIGNMQGSVKTVQKPDGFLVARAVFIVVSGSRVFLDPRSREFLLDYWPSTTTYSQPLYFSDEHNTAQILVSPTPDLDYQWGAVYSKRPAGLSSSNTSTWLSTNVGDALLHACLIECEKFVIEDERLQMWSTEYARLTQAAKQEFAPLIAKRY